MNDFPITGGTIPAPVKVVLYGVEGIGKSSLAARFPGAVFIDTEDGTKRLNVRRLPAPSSWQMLTEEVAAASPAATSTTWESAEDAAASIHKLSSESTQASPSAPCSPVDCGTAAPLACADSASATATAGFDYSGLDLPTVDTLHADYFARNLADLIDAGRVVVMQ